MAELPSGTVTFLFTDIEGSTARWERHPTAMRDALARHDALLHAGITAHHGVVLKEHGEGDSFFALFARPSDALAASCTLQRALAVEPWPEDVAPLRVRMAVHTGEAGLWEGRDYRGTAVNRCARLRSLAHGGQVLVSGVTYELARDALPPGITLRDLGEHRLKDLTRPEHVYQLLHPDLPAAFPPLLSLDQGRNGVPTAAPLSEVHRARDQQPSSSPRANVVGKEGGPAGQRPPAARPLIGREAELARLLQFLEDVARGTGRIVLLRGEPGIGKTRLAQEALARALERGFIALEGQSYPLESGLAYAPILAAFRPLWQRLDPAGRAHLTQGLPDLGRLFPELDLPAPEPLGDMRLEKTRLYEAVSRLLQRLAQQAPVILFLDDLQWADAASLELLQYLGHGLGQEAVLLLGACRTDEADALRRLRPLLTSLRRAGLADELDVCRVTSTDTAALARNVLDGAASNELLAMLEARAAGTPLFVEALIEALRDADQLMRTEQGWTVRAQVVDLPSSVRHLILDRLDRLDSTDRHILDRVAVGGGSLSYDVLQAASELDEASLLQALDRLLARGLVVEIPVAGDVGYGLTHPLLQEVAYGELSTPARRRAHLAYAAALERLQPAEFELLAFHYHAAGSTADRARALEVFLTAGERARSVYAHEEAARHFQAALELIRAGHHTELLPSVLEKLGGAWERVGQNTAAIRVWSEALEAYARGSEPHAIARLHCLLARAKWESGAHAGAAHAHLAAGVAVLQGQPPAQELADLYLLRAVILTRFGDLAGAVTTAQELRALAERLRSPRVVAQAELALMRPHLLQGNFVAVREAGLRALTAMDASEDIAQGQQIHHQLALVAAAMGDYVLAQHHGQASLELARRLGNPALEAIAHAPLVHADLFAGAWDAAVQQSDEALVVARRTGQGRAAGIALVLRANVLLYRGELAMAEPLLNEVREQLGGDLAASYYAVLGVHGQVWLALERGDVRQLRELLPQVAGHGLMDIYPQALGIVVESQLAVGDVHGALAEVRRVQAVGDRCGPFLVAMTTRLDGLARGALGETTAAVERLTQASDRFRTLAMPFEAARAHLERAAWSADEETVATLKDSLEVFEHLGAQRYAERARKALRRLGVRPRPVRRPGPEGGPLSRRELEVARLVAEGLTTAQVAARLIISLHTADTHVRRIYERLDVHSRAGLVRYLSESGLL